MPPINAYPRPVSVAFDLIVLEMKSKEDMALPNAWSRVATESSANYQPEQRSYLGKTSRSLPNSKEQSGRWSINLGFTPVLIS